MEEKSPVYLVMVTTNNNNKYYRMIPHGDTFEVEYGRVGASLGGYSSLRNDEIVVYKEEQCTIKYLVELK